MESGIQPEDWQCDQVAKRFLQTTESSVVQQPAQGYRCDMGFVPDDFGVPVSFDGPGFQMEPLGPQHNQRDHEAWMSSIDHIWNTPDFPDDGWPTAMSLESNLADLERHAKHFEDRVGFTYSILDGDEVIGCLYVYPSRTADAAVSSWVRASRAPMDIVIWKAVSKWLETEWPFGTIEYGSR